MSVTVETLKYKLGTAIKTMFTWLANVKNKAVTQ